MPRPKPTEAIEASRGIQEGTWLVLEAAYRIATFGKEGGEQYHPAVLALTATPVNKDLEPIDEEQKTTEDIVICFPGKETGDYRFLPGNSKNANDDDPEPVEGEPGDEGNALWCEEGTNFFKDSAYVIFCDSLIAAGFKPDVVDQSFAPNFNGLIFEAERKPDKGDKNGKRTNLVAKKILRYPYESKGKGKAKGAKAGAGKAASKANGKASGDEDLMAAFAAGVEVLLGDEDNHGTHEAGDFKGLLRKSLKEAGVKVTDAVKACKLVEDEDWMAAHFEDVGLTGYDPGEGVTVG